MGTTPVLKPGIIAVLVASWIAVVLPVLAGTTLPGPAAAAEAPGAITLSVRSARSVAPGPGFVHKDDPISDYRWMINVDDTGDPGTSAAPGTEKCLPATAAGGSTDPDFADTCPWPSIRNTSGFSPIVAQGDQSTLGTSKALQGLAPGKYLISVLSDGFKIDGQHFTVTSGSTTAVSVGMNPTPLPLSTIRIQVFEDQAPVDATYEADAERGLQGFGAHLTDVFGEVSTDYYGNPLCTAYQHEGGDPTAPIVFDAGNKPVVDAAHSAGRCLSDASGEIVIPNLGPDRYAAVVTPPAAQTDQWVQTTTLEGATDHDIWVQEGETGLDNEVLKGGEPVPMVVFGFARPQTIPVPAVDPPTGEVKGVVVGGLPYIGGKPGLSYETGFPNTKVEGPISRPWVALSDLGAGDAAIYVGRGDTTGAFDIKNVPNGTYQLSVWDANLDYILWSFNVTVRNGKASNVGNKMIVGWFTHVHGHVFVDSNENGVRDPGEAGVPGFTMTVRERDNSLMDQYTNTKSTDDSGAYDIRETYPLGKWLVLEAFNTRYRTTGITYRGDNETSSTTKLGGLVDLDFLPIIGLGGTIDWGVKPYTSTENGGIAGTVSYDTTRNELDPADAASEAYQPGIPNVDVHLYASTPCTATTAVAKENSCRSGKAMTPNQVPDPSPSSMLLSKTGTLNDANGNGVADADETVDYGFTVTNTGTTTLHGLTVSDPAAGPVSCPADTLAAGAHVDCTAGSHQVTGAEVTAGVVRNQAVARASDPAGDPVTSAPSDVEVATNAPAGIALVKRGTLADTDADGRADAGETVSYAYTITNTGTATPASLKVSDPEMGKVICPLSMPAPGGRAVCTGTRVVTLHDVLAAAVTNTAIATATMADGSTLTSAPSTETIATDRMVANPDPDRGAMVRGPELDSTTSETWQPPRGCTAYDYKGNVLTDQRALPEFGETANRMCVEAPMMGVAIGPSDKTPGDAAQTVNGNYGFSTSKLNLYPPGNANNPAPNHDLPLYADLAAAGYPDQDLRPADYLVGVDLPENPVGGGHMYQVTDEESVNVFDGDSYLPQENMAAITPAEAQDPPPGLPPTPVEPSQPPSQQAGVISACAGAYHTVRVTNQNFLDGGGSPFEGLDNRPSCGTKLVSVRAGQASAPNFNLYTPVPIPTHFWGVTLNDLGLTFDKRSVNYGEAQGLPFVPVGLYDYAGRLVDTVHTDFNGLYEGLEPSTSTYNCPLPAGPCPNMYRFVGNDPGQPGALNSDYNPRFRTIAANFQGWPGLYTVTDEAPTQVANVALSPDGTTANPTQCDLGTGFPQVFSVDRPYVRRNVTTDTRRVVVRGTSFGATAGTLSLGGTTVPTTLWATDRIEFTVPATTPLGAQALKVTTSAGASSFNGLTIQVIDGRATVANSATNPQVVDVGPGTGRRPTIQAGLEAATQRYALVAVWPNAQTSGNPRGEYTENVIVHKSVHLQGVGPGGFTPTGAFVPGSIIDGLGFNPDNQQGADWLSLLGGLTYSGDPQVPVGATVTVLDDPSRTTPGYTPMIDGFTITGGVQLDMPTNVNTITGGTKTPYGAVGSLTSQGGGVYVHSNVRNIQVSDNVIVGNGGSYGGGIRIGTPYVADNGNTAPTITRNQVRDNGGSNLAGGIGIFAGSDGYQVTDNAICGNFSAEYGGAATAFGYQNNAGGTFRGNRIWFNSSYDEGGGIMVAGELPADPTQLSEGTGPVTIDRNMISTNFANDDGGGIRLLMASGSHISSDNRGTIRITNNTIANNVSAHEGGGIALDDAAFVDVVNNTIAKNLTTATAITSDGTAAPAGLSTATNSDPLQARLRDTALFPNATTLGNTTWSNPTVFNDVFFDNRAGSYSGGTITGIGVLPDGTNGGIVNWDLGMTDVPAGLLAPTSSVLQTTRGTTTSGTNTVTSSPGLKAPYDLQVDVISSRTYPAFRVALVVAGILPANLTGDYHLSGTGSPAYGRGTARKNVNWGPVTQAGQWPQVVVSAPTTDIDNQTRPTGSSPARWDAGSDQFYPAP